MFWLLRVSLQTYWPVGLYTDKNAQHSQFWSHISTLCLTLEERGKIPSFHEQFDAREVAVERLRDRTGLPSRSLFSRLLLPCFTVPTEWAHFFGLQQKWQIQFQSTFVFSWVSLKYQCICITLIWYYGSRICLRRDAKKLIAVFFRASLVSGGGGRWRN